MGWWEKIPGIGRIFGEKVAAQQEAQQQVQVEAEHAIEIGQEVVAHIDRLVSSLDEFRPLITEIDGRDQGSQRLGNFKIAAMKGQLEQIHQTRSVSQEQTEVRTVMNNFAQLVTRFKTLPNYSDIFQDPLNDIGDELRELERLLNIEESILQGEFEKLGEQR